MTGKAQDDVVLADPAVAFDALANDRALDGELLHLLSTTAPLHGTVDCGELGGCVFVADPSFEGQDGFDYTIVDESGVRSQAHVTVDVTPGGGATRAIARNDVIDTTTGVAETVDMLADDGDESPLQIASNSDPSHGSVICSLEGLCTYTPEAGFAGFDGFRYELQDGFGNRASADVEISVLDRGTSIPTVVGRSIPPAPDEATVTQGRRRLGGRSRPRPAWAPREFARPRAGSHCVPLWSPRAESGLLHQRTWVDVGSNPERL